MHSDLEEDEPPSSTSLDTTRWRKTVPVDGEVPSFAPINSVNFQEHVKISFHKWNGQLAQGRRGETAVVDASTTFHIDVVQKQPYNNPRDEQALFQVRRFFWHWLGDFTAPLIDETYFLKHFEELEKR